MLRLSSNPFAQAAQPLQYTIEADPYFLDVFELLAEDIALAITRPVGSLKHEIIVLVDSAQRADLEALLENVGRQCGRVPHAIRCTELAAINWVEKVQKDFPPFCVEHFYVYGSHADEKKPANTIALCIDAAAAFGTGEHATTAGCLRAIAKHSKRNRRITHALDMGCGTAILAIAAAKQFAGSRISACDNDAKAVEVSRHNVRVNRVHPKSRVFLSDGYRYKKVQQHAPYPLIIANILARPLMKMARQASCYLARGGTIMLSGIMRHQVNMVLMAYRAQGMQLREVRYYGQWSVIVMVKP